MSITKAKTFRLIRFWVLCGLAFASPAIVIAFNIRPVADALMIAAIGLLGVLAGPFSQVMSIIFDEQPGYLAWLAVLGGILILALFWMLLRREASPTILKAIIVLWCFLGFALAIVPALLWIT